ncbi:hydrolase Nlp/P60 [Mucilaginibacter limnophilus]|uniref:Hydrolase Nlp/P60 n=1 Tax=Mucilaginibacter limnophilus TaxID=1932778 RepID=A0A3S2UR87_9SPHI|nr:C40 family peptidase [Mucilaginibacter limnophilus]RVU02673.1 hydrolase Nlp/P60 [Mucilaginibacter limnophilus]
MEYGICNLAVVPLRAEGNERSEQVSQVLFGETFEIVEWQENWVKIITTYDDYTGWIARLQFEIITAADYQEILISNIILTSSAVSWVFRKTDMGLLYLPFGSSLPLVDGNECRVGNQTYIISEEEEPEESIAETAMQFMNVPYLWGGRTHFGIDCSGLTQAVYRHHGIKIDRDASQQVKQGTLIENLDDAKAGDLAFFENEKGNITHVGIMLGDGLIIHASGKVKIDTIDEHGIYSEEQQRHTHRFNCIRTYV